MATATPSRRSVCARMVVRRNLSQIAGAIDEPYHFPASAWPGACGPQRTHPDHPRQAAKRPHFSRGSAHFVGPNDFVGAGIATHLGCYDEAGHVVFSPTDDPTVLHLEASAIYTAANGDHLYAEFTGELNGLTGAITATVTYVGGTGRFTNASGTASLVAQILADGSLEVVVRGTIEF